MIKTLLGKAQSDGAQVIDFDVPNGEGLKCYHHVIDVTVRNAAGAATAPSAGTLKVECVSHVESESGAIVPSAKELGNSPIDLVNGPLQLLFDGYYQQIILTPTGLDADKTYDVHVTSGD